MAVTGLRRILGNLLTPFKNVTTKKGNNNSNAVLVAENLVIFLRLL